MIIVKRNRPGLTQRVCKFTIDTVGDVTRSREGEASAFASTPSLVGWAHGCHCRR